MFVFRSSFPTQRKMQPMTTAKTNKENEKKLKRTIIFVNKTKLFRQ